MSKPEETSCLANVFVGPNTGSGSRCNLGDGRGDGKGVRALGPWVKYLRFEPMPDWERHDWRESMIREMDHFGCAFESRALHQPQGDPLGRGVELVSSKRFEMSSRWDLAELEAFDRLPEELRIANFEGIDEVRMDYKRSGGL